MVCGNCGSTSIKNHENLGTRKRLKCRSCGKSWTVKTSTGDIEVNISDDISDDSRTITARSGDITSLDDLLKYSAVDLSVWSVKRHIVNSWEVTNKEGKTFTNYQVKAWLEPAGDTTNLKDNLEAFKASIFKYTRKHPAKTYKKKKDGRLLEIGLMDHHFGQLAWGEETGGENYDIKIAYKLANDAIDAILAEVDLSRIDRILLPIGNDFFNVNSSANTTFAGTPQSEDERFKKTFKSGLDLWVGIIDRLSDIAPVDVPIVPGNHDEERIFYLGVALESWYRNCDYVTVDNGPKLRKAYTYGLNLIVLSHGDKEVKGTLVSLMAIEFPDLWAKSKYREIHLGHLHYASSKAFQVLDQYHSVNIVVFPPLVSRDDWHAAKGYSSLRETLAIEWTKTKGRACQHYFHP